MSRRVAIRIFGRCAAIREEYTNFELETTDGLLLTGFITERGAQSITIEDGQQGRITILKARIKHLQASALSRMPEKEHVEFLLGRKACLTSSR